MWFHTLHKVTSSVAEKQGVQLERTPKLESLWGHPAKTVLEKKLRTDVTGVK